MARFELVGGVHDEVKRHGAVKGGAILLSALALTACGTQSFENAAQEQPETVTVTANPNNEAPVIESTTLPETQAPTKTKLPTFIKGDNRPADCYLMDAATVMCSPEKSGVYYLNGNDANTADAEVNAQAGMSFVLQTHGAITSDCGNVTVAYAKNEGAAAQPFFRENVCSNDTLAH